MKADIHPTFYKDAQVNCVCGNSFTTGSVMKEMKIDICSACHPFFSGKQRIVDTEGRVERFKKKYASFYTAKK